MIHNHFQTNPCLLCDAQTMEPTLICKPCFEDFTQPPNACFKCGIPLESLAISHKYNDSKRIACGSCLSESPSFDYTLSAFLYAQPLDYLIRQFKFSNQLLTGYALAKLMIKVISPIITHKPQCLIPVPLHRKKLISRGYNQAQELAYPIAKALDIDLDLSCCTRTKNTEPQSTLAKSNRIENMKNAFAVTTPIAADHVVLIDDIMTTGNTLNELAKQLKKSGVKTVGVWVCARAVLD